MNKVFLDTNVLVYACDHSSPHKREKAREILRENADRICISMQVMQEFYMVATRKLSITPLQAKKILASFESAEIVLLEVQDIHSAIDQSLAWQISFWDALIITSARKARCAVLYTEDLNDGQTYDSVTVKNPFV